MGKLAWSIKYRPNKIEDYIFQDDKHKALVVQYIKEKNIPNLLLSGHRGTGKTSLAYLLKNALEIEDTDFLKLNASDENSIEVIRTKVKGFINTVALGDFKVVFLDEFDACTINAQQALKSMMEEYYENVRFILANNHPHKIIPEIHSRCEELVFKSLDKSEMLIKTVKILKAESIKGFNLDLLDKYVSMVYPDFRKLLNLLQQNIINGVLQDPVETSETIQDKMQMMELIDGDRWDELREHVCKTATDDDWEDMYRFLYDYLHEVGKFKDIMKWKKGIIIIADHLFRHTTIADAEINFSACMIRLSEV